MEFFIIKISETLFLIIVLHLSVSVLANYSGNEPAKGSPAEVKAAQVNKDGKNADLVQ